MSQDAPDPFAKPPANQPPAYQPPAPAPTYQPGQPPAPGQGGGVQPMTQTDERLWAMLGHLGAILLGFLSPLIVWLVFRERSALVNDQGKEALNFQITVILGYVAASVLSIIGIGLLLYPLVWIGALVLAIVGGLAANKGQFYRYPVCLRLIK